MPYLGDYLGHLMAEVTIARLHADLEAVRVAELYASHPLLRTMPVPRVRVADVEMRVPVVIEKVDDPREGESPRGGIPIEKLIPAFDRALSVPLRKHNIRPTAAQFKKLGALIQERLETVRRPIETAVDVTRLADELAQEITRSLAELRKPDFERPNLVSRFGKDLREAARIEFLKERAGPPRLHVLVTSKEIREAGPSEAIVHIDLKISEDGMEWTSIESDQGSEDRLIPE